MFDKKTQPKDERPPLHGFGDNLQGWSGEETQGGQSNRALLKLMKLLEERIEPDPFPVYYRSPVVPNLPAPDERLIEQYLSHPRADLSIISKVWK